MLSVCFHALVLFVTPAPRVVNAPSSMLLGAPAASMLVRVPFSLTQPVALMDASSASSTVDKSPDPDARVSCSRAASVTLTGE
eukprot:6138631-Amphidinium_carterae.2